MQRPGLFSVGSPGLNALIDSRAVLAVESAALLLVAVSVATRYWQDHAWAGPALLAAAGGTWTPELFRRRARLWWFMYVTGIFAYTLLRALADETGIPTQTDYVITFDRWVGLGHHPIEALQGAFFRPDETGVLDWLAVAVHWSFFIGPHALAILISVRRRRQFPAYAMLVVGTMYAGLLLFFLVPTTPPWLAAQTGELTDVYRVMDFVGGRVSGDTYEDFYASLGEPNSVAAMPSIHLGVTLAMYLWARVYARRWRRPLLVYSVVMGLALVYLAEHYILDLLAGAVLACAIDFAVRRWGPQPLYRRGAQDHRIGHMTNRQPRRARRPVAPARSLPRPATPESVEEADGPATRSASRRAPQVPRAHHVAESFDYVRGDLVTVAAVGAVVVAFIVGMSFLV